jgi:hypothetical protein
VVFWDPVSRTFDSVFYRGDIVNEEGVVALTKHLARIPGAIADPVVISWIEISEKTA